MIVTVAMTAPGCHRLPVAHVAALPALPPTRPDTPAVAPAPALRPEPGMYGTSPPPPPSSLSPRPVIEVARTPSATPLLDRALARAEALTHSDDDPACDFECDVPDPPPGPAAAEPKAKGSALANLAVKGLPDAPAAHKPIDPDRSAKIVTPRDVWREDLERLRAMARDRAIASPEVGALQARLLDWIAEPEAEKSPLWRTVIRALVAATGPEPSEEGARGSEIRAAVEALEDRASLEITELQLCRKVRGFGDFEPLDANTCKPGQSMIVYCEMSGLRYERSDEAFQSRLSSRVEIVPAQGGRPVWEHAGSATEICRRRRRDYYVNCVITLPDHLAPGTYELRVTQKDEVAGRATSSAIVLILKP